MLLFGKPIDGGLIDALTLLVGLLMVVIKILIRRYKGQQPIASAQAATIDFLNGVVILPFLMISASVFSPNLIPQNTVSVALAGGVGLSLVLGELFRRTE